MLTKSGAVHEAATREAGNPGALEVPGSRMTSRAPSQLTRFPTQEVGPLQERGNAKRPMHTRHALHRFALVHTCGADEEWAVTATSPQFIRWRTAKRPFRYTDNRGRAAECRVQMASESGHFVRSQPDIAIDDYDSWSLRQQVEDGEQTWKLASIELA